MANPNDWSQFYNNQSFFSTAVTTTSSSAAGDSRLSPETGRVSKPARRRSRASRRTPTTLLHTDTTNFRAMVQQFTGGPTAMAFGSGSVPGSGFTLTPPSSNPALDVAGDGSHPSPSWQYTFPRAPTPPPPQQHPRPYMFSLSNLNHDVMGAVGGVNAVVSGGFPAGMEDGGGGGWAPPPPSHGLGPRNGKGSSGLQ